MADTASKYSTEVLKLAATQTKLTDSQATAIFKSKILTDAELKQAVSTATLSASEAAATGTTAGLSAAFKGLWATLKANPILLAIGVAALGFTALSKYKQYVEETRKAAADSANTYKETTSSINDYVSKYQELRQALIAAKGDETETYDVKRQLLELQTELNEAYGDEYGRLNLVTDAYKDQTKAIKAYSKEAANKLLNEIGEKGIRDAKNQMLNEKQYNLSSTGISLYSDEGLAIQELAEKHGIKVNKDESSGTFNLILKADAATAESTINEFMSDVRDLRDNGDFGSAYIFDDILDFSGRELHRVQDIISESGDTLRQILIAEIVKDDDDLTQKYNSAIESVEAYNEAVLKAEDPYNDENVAKARQAMEDARSAFSTEEIEKYGYVVSEVFDEADTSAYDFNQALKNDDGLKTLATDLEGLSNLDLQSFDQNVGENTSFDKLKESAEEYDVSADELIDTLVRLGYVQGELSEQDAQTVNFDSESFLKSISAIQSGYETLLKAQEEFNEYGAVSASTLKNLMDDGLIQYLQYTSDGLSINTASLEDNEQALKDAATAELYNAMCNDIQNLSLEDTGRLSSIAQTAITNLDSAANTAGKNASIAAQGWWEYGASIESIPGVSDLTDDNREKAEAIINRYKSIANSINSLSIGNTDLSKKSDISSTAKAAEDAEKAAKDYVDSYMSYMEASLEAGITDYQNYAREVSSFLKNMYDDGKIAAQDYFNYQKQMLETQKSIYDKVISAVTARIDSEIDGIRDTIDSLEEQNDSLQSQLDDYDRILSVVDSVYQKEIDSLNEQKELLQDKIDSINEANDSLDLQYRKEQALYELKRAQEQRTKKVFNGTEFIYTTDEYSIRQAQNDLRDIETEEIIRGLEAEQKQLEETAEALEKFRDLWAGISDAYDEEINTQLAVSMWGEDYAQLILSNRLSDIDSFKNDYISARKTISANQEMIDSYNEKIEYYETLKEQWSSVTDAYEQEQARQYAAMILGSEWESDVLSGRLETLKSFRDEYISIQQSIAAAALEYANAAAAAGADTDESASSGSPGTSGSLGSSGNKGSTSSNAGAKYKVVDENGNNLAGFVGSGAETKAETYRSSLDDAIHDIKKVDIVPYASGTTNAKKGLNLVGEKGTEAYIDNDGNVSLVTKPSLIPMEGGETVINAAGTGSLLNTDNMPATNDTITLCGLNGHKVQLSMIDFLQRLQSVMPDYSSMIQPMVYMPKYDDIHAHDRENNTSISIGDIHLHEVQNVDSLANAIISNLPNKTLQAMHKRK